MRRTTIEKNETFYRMESNFYISTSPFSAFSVLVWLVVLVVGIID